MKIKELTYIDVEAKNTTFLEINLIKINIFFAEKD